MGSVSTEWILALVVALLGSNLIVAIYTRRSSRKDAVRDRAQDVTDANAGKLIDADQKALEIIVGRLETVENELKEIRKDHNSLMVENEGLRKDAEHNEKELVKQAEEIKTLRERNHKLSNDIQQRDAKIGELERKHDREISELKTLVATLEAQLNQFRSGNGNK